VNTVVEASVRAEATLTAVALRYTRGTLTLSFVTSLALGFTCGLFLLELPGVQVDWLAVFIHTVLLGKWPVLAAGFFVLVRMSVLAPHGERPEAALPFMPHSLPSHALAYAGASGWITALAWAVALLALVAGLGLGMELAHPERVAEVRDVLLTTARGDEVLRSGLRAVLVGLALGWMIEAESRIDHPWQDDTGTRSMQLIVLGLLLIVMVELTDAWLFWLPGGDA
jgi:hypothetical protein